MVQLWLVILALVAMPEVAFSRQGSWEFNASEDPITDQRTGIVAVDGDGVSVGLKCWGGEPNSTNFMVLLQSRFDDAASYKSSIDVLVRVDKNDPIALSLKPVSMGGRLALIGIRESEPKITSIIDEIRLAKTRVAVAFADTVETVTARGAAKAIGSFIEGCSQSK